MKTANEQLRDGLIRHQIRVLNYSSGLSQRAQKHLLDTEEELERIVLFYANRLHGKPISSPQSKNALRRMNTEIKNLRKSAWTKITNDLQTELLEFGITEGSFVTELVRDVLPVESELKTPKRARMREIVLDTPMGGEVLRDWLKSSEQADLNTLNREIRNGLRTDLPVDAIVANVVNSGLTRGNRTVARRAFTGVEALTVTATNTIQNETILTTMESNPWVATEERFSAVLDGATTPICIQYDGDVFEIGKGPRPPLHFRCRSLRLPVITPDSITSRPTRAATESQLVGEYVARENLDRGIKARSRLPHGHKGAYDAYERGRIREIIGRVPETLSYSDWLRTQSVAFQNSVLGIARGRLFRKEQLHLRHYVNRTTGQFLTLEELARRGRTLD